MNTGFDASTVCNSAGYLLTHLGGEMYIELKAAFVQFVYPQDCLDYSCSCVYESQHCLQVNQIYFQHSLVDGESGRIWFYTRVKTFNDFQFGLPMPCSREEQLEKNKPLLKLLDPSLYSSFTHSFRFLLHCRHAYHSKC